MSDYLKVRLLNNNKFNNLKVISCGFCMIIMAVSCRTSDPYSGNQVSKYQSKNSGKEGGRRLKKKINKEEDDCINPKMIKKGYLPVKFPDKSKETTKDSKAPGEPFKKLLWKVNKLVDEIVKLPNDLPEGKKQECLDQKNLLGKDIDNIKKEDLKDIKKLFKGLWLTKVKDSREVKGSLTPKDRQMEPAKLYNMNKYLATRVKDDFSWKNWLNTYLYRFVRLIMTKVMKAFNIPLSDNNNVCKKYFEMAQSERDIFVKHFFEAKGVKKGQYFRAGLVNSTNKMCKLLDYFQDFKGLKSQLKKASEEYEKVDPEGIAAHALFKHLSITSKIVIDAIDGCIKLKTLPAIITKLKREFWFMQKFGMLLVKRYIKKHIKKVDPKDIKRDAMIKLFKIYVDIAMKFICVFENKDLKAVLNKLSS